MDKESLLKEIADVEYNFFKRINMENEECKREKTFKRMRMVRFYPLSVNTLESYLNDLKMASVSNTNPLREKYICIDKHLPVENPLIDRIVEIESGWMNELREKYPHIFVNKGDEFKTYLKCELTTFSKETLKLYHEDVANMKDNGTNMAEVSYTYLFEKIGYNSLQEAEESQKSNLKQQN
ncbi:MAG: DUF4125 family protein [Synergistetes bacterium]|nr:DUF4125 family protein [Synergistota bacterium]